MDKNGFPTEAKLTQGLTHPSIVGMHAYKLLRDTRRASIEDQEFRGRAPCKTDELWLILDLCDKGSMQVQMPIRST